MPHLLAIDQGTTSTRAIVFDTAGCAVATAQRELPQIYPRDGWVEHDPEEIWDSVLETYRRVIAEVGIGDIAAIGITNQRETTLIWNRRTGAPIDNAIVWQDRRTADLCTRLQKAGHGEMVRSRTGLVLDPYFSATKIRWLLDNVPGAADAAHAGDLAFGTVDSFLLWRLTGGAVHATDATNAARTMLFDIHKQQWDKDLLELLDIPAALLPEVKDNAANFGNTLPDLFGKSLPITGMAGDQQAATVGQACFERGMIKSTYGTGCFALLNTGRYAAVSHNGLLTTVAYRLNGVPTYALEGSIFIAGAAVQWLRDSLGLIADAAETEKLAAGLVSNEGVYMVPAFTGLGTPHWDPHARGAIFGLTRDTGIAHLARAALEAVCYQTHDLLAAMAEDGAAEIATLRVDGGMAANGWLMQFLADITGLAVERPTVTETTALGAACLAGLGAGIYASLDDIAATWRSDTVFRPEMDGAERARLLAGWDRAIARVRTGG